ncbi:unnamed protein product [Mortierella alpina]
MNRDPFWSQPGMRAFLDWVTDPECHTEFINVSHSERRTAKLFDRVARLVNASMSGYANKMDWVGSTAKRNYEDVKQRYLKAKLLHRLLHRLSIWCNANEDEKAKLRAMVLERCPFFHELDPVMRRHFSRTTSPVDEGKRVAGSSEEGSSDSDDDNNVWDNSDSDSGMKKTSLSVEKGTEEEHAAKRNKHDRPISHAESRATLDNMNNANSARAAAHSSGVGNGTTASYLDERWADIRRREEMLEQRESNWLQKQDMARKVHLQEFDAAMQRRREEMDREKAEFNEAKLEFKKEMAEFRTERDKMLRENAHLKALASVHSVRM